MSRQATRLGWLAIVSITCSLTGIRAGETRTLEFRREVQNVPAVSRVLREEPARGAMDVCPKLSGTARYGAIPHRLAGEAMTESGHFVDFAAVYGESQPALLIDLDQDGVLTCDERVELVRHPVDTEILFRTLVLTWNDDGPDRRQRYRLKLPAQLADTPQEYEIELVDVPVGRWKEGDRTVLWMLYDGNYDGLFGSKFGDGVLIDVEGTGQFDLSVGGPHFRSFHETLPLPWGAFLISEVAATGDRLVLEAVGEEALEPRYAEGDVVPSLGCQSIDGQSLQFAGGSDRHQVLFFWVSNCPSCYSDAQELAALAGRIGPERMSVVGVSMDEDRARSQEFVRVTGADWPHCFSGRVLWDNAVARRFGVDSPSDYVIIDPSGRLAIKGNGIDALEDALARMVSAVEVGEVVETDRVHFAVK